MFALDIDSHQTSYTDISLVLLSPVIHRDIQPSNIIVSGAQPNNELWWSDEVDVSDKVRSIVDKCKITLLDFGFARSLAPHDVGADVGLQKLVDESDCPKFKTNGKQYRGSWVGEAMEDTSYSTKDTDASEETRGRVWIRELDDSISHRKVRDLSKCLSHLCPELLILIPYDLTQTCCTLRCTGNTTLLST